MPVRYPRAKPPNKAPWSSDPRYSPSVKSHSKAAKGQPQKRLSVPIKHLSLAYKRCFAAGSSSLSSSTNTACHQPRGRSFFDRGFKSANAVSFCYNTGKVGHFRDIHAVCVLQNLRDRKIITRPSDSRPDCVRNFHL